VVVAVELGTGQFTVNSIVYNPFKHFFPRRLGARRAVLIIDGQSGNKNKRNEEEKATITLPAVLSNER